MRFPLRSILLVVILAVVAAACGAAEGVPPAAPTTPGPADTATTATSPTTVAGTDAPDPGAAGYESVEGVTLLVSERWRGVALGQGTKPVLALDASGSPGVAWVLERLSGSITYVAAAEGWQPQTVVEGYFYGPIGLTFDAAGRPVVAYHDHQATLFEDDLGDLTIATRTGSTWEHEAVRDDGHDGWDSTIVAAVDGTLHAAGIDPQQFGRNVGVEHYAVQDGRWRATEIGSGPIAYEFNVGLAVDGSGEPALSYYDNNDRSLQLARRSAGEWVIETVDADGDAGRYSSLAFDAAGRPHLSYVDLVSPNSATVRHATNDGSGWSITDVSTLDDIATGFTGARRVTHVQVDGGGRPHIVMGDRSGVYYARHDGSSWSIETVATAGSLPLGQLVSFALDAEDRPHIALFEQTGERPLDGVVVYLTSG